MSLPQRAISTIKRLPSHLHTQLTRLGKLHPSPHQTSALTHLDRLTLSLTPHSSALRAHNAHVNHLRRLRDAAIAAPSRLHTLRLLLHGHAPSADPARLPNSFFRVPDPPPAPTPPKGVYLFGDVGSGKSLLMDILFECAPLAAARIHFHPFMMNVYQALHEYDELTGEERVEKGLGHPLDAVVTRLPDGLLCFDEFQITDVADARLMHGVFERLLQRGTVVCFTANRTPEDVNRSQMREDDFLPFLRLLNASCDLVEVEGVDYRAVLAGEDQHMECYLKPDETKQLHEAWHAETGVAWDTVVSAEWEVGYGRSVLVRRVAPGKAVQMSVKELLENPVGAADYRAIARNADAIFFEDVVPRFVGDTRNLARRFITLVDVCYEEKVRLFMRMESGLEDLFDEEGFENVDVQVAEGLQFEGEVGKEGVGEGNRDFGKGNVYTGEDERFAFRRAVSRLREMSTKGFGRRLVWEEQTF